jgi:hypothetical protein
MGFDLNKGLLRSTKDAVQALWWIKRRQGVEEICEAMLPRKHPIREGAIPAIDPALLSRKEGEVSPGDSSGRQQPRKQHVCTKVHMVMSVNPAWLPAMQPLELLNLCRHNIVK